MISGSRGHPCKFATKLPDLRLEEALETTNVYSTTGLLAEKNPLMVSRPFRSPHHTVSMRV